MESLWFLALLSSAALLRSAQCVPAGRARLRRDLSYEDRMMSLPVPEEKWRGRGLEQALQRLVERDQRREQQEEQQRAAYVSAVMRLLSDAESAGLINPELQLEIDQEEDLTPHLRSPQRPLQTAQDYDETGPVGITMTRPRTPYWRLVEPQLAQALFQRLDPDMAEALLNKLQQNSAPRDTDQDTLRRLVAQIVSGLGPSEAVMSSGHSRSRRDLSDPAPSATNPAHRRSRRSLEDTPPSDEPQLLRVKRLDEDEVGPRPLQGLQRMKRVDAEEDHGSRRRKRRAIVNYSPQVLLRQVLELIGE